ncbi:MAG: DHH family phosphoesterase [Candidatus Saccharimonas sp.]
MIKSLFERILESRGLTGDSVDSFMKPDYASGHDPFLLPDMREGVDRLEAALKADEKITIYGDYDIDGLTATTVLVEALAAFGFKDVETYIPNRFVEGYGLTVGAVENIAATGTKLIITVDCGSLSEVPIIRAAELGIEVIVTDHHNVAPVQPPAVAVINPKRLLQDYPEEYENYVLKKDSVAASSDTAASVLVVGDVAVAGAVDSSRDGINPLSQQPAKLGKPQTFSAGLDTELISSGLVKAPATATSPPPQLYPFLDLPGVGVAFKLVQALQTRLDGIPAGQEKWLLDLVALGTVCDVVTLIDENRIHVYWGLKVLAKTRRPGLSALMAVAGVDPAEINARHLGFGLGPRMNASGRLETARFSQDLLLTNDKQQALELATKLDDMNVERRSMQDKIFKAAIEQAIGYVDDSVLVLSHADWSHGIVGIVAAKILEKYQKPAFILQELGQDTKGSARSYGDFSAADAIRSADDIITKGGGHKLAAGVTLPTKNIAKFRAQVNSFYKSIGLDLTEQRLKLLPRADVVASLAEIDESLVRQISTLEPFGSGNPAPVLKTENLTVRSVRKMGSDGQHVKLSLSDGDKTMEFLAFSAPKECFVDVGAKVSVWYRVEVNEWRDRRNVEGRLLHLEIA